MHKNNKRLVIPTAMNVMLQIEYDNDINLDDDIDSDYGSTKTPLFCCFIFSCDSDVLCLFFVLFCFVVCFHGKSFQFEIYIKKKYQACFDSYS